MPDVTAKKSFVCDSFIGHVKDYASFVKNRGYFSVRRDFLYRAVASMWDNTARRKNDSLVLDGVTPDLYRAWLLDVINETKYQVAHQKLDDFLVFINAWNEWAEGAYLEPDLRWHYGYLEATKDALLAARYSSDHGGIFFLFHFCNKLAVRLYANGMSVHAISQMLDMPEEGVQRVVWGLSQG